MSNSLKTKQLTFDQLVQSICSVNETFSAQAAKAINISLTLRNWLIGMYIAEFELRGADRAKYGQRLVDELTLKLADYKISGCGRRQLYNYMTFYRAYPQIVRTVSAQFKQLSLSTMKSLEKVRTPSAQLETDPEKLISCLSYSHFEMLFETDDPLKQTFYEHECLRGNWSVRELRRQISTLYFERSGLSKNKKKLAEMVSQKTEINKPEFAVRDPYIFEFLFNKITGDKAFASVVKDYLLKKVYGRLKQPAEDQPLFYSDVIPEATSLF